MYGRFYLPTGRLDALYSTRLAPTIQAMVAAISDPPSSALADMHSRTTNVSNIMLSLQHDIGKWCTEYSYSAEDGMWGIRLLHNFGRLGTPAEPCQVSSRVKVKRVDEEDSVEGGLKGRFSMGAELYFSAKEKSAGGLNYQCALACLSADLYFQSRLAYGSQLFRMLRLHLLNFHLLNRHKLLSFTNPQRP